MGTPTPVSMQLLQVQQDRHWRERNIWELIWMLIVFTYRHGNKQVSISGERMVLKLKEALTECAEWLQVFLHCGTIIPPWRMKCGFSFLQCIMPFNSWLFYPLLLSFIAPPSPFPLFHLHYTCTSNWLCSSVGACGLCCAFCLLLWSVLFFFFFFTAVYMEEHSSTEGLSNQMHSSHVSQNFWQTIKMEQILFQISTDWWGRRNGNRRHEWIIDISSCMYF